MLYMIAGDSLNEKTAPFLLSLFDIRGNTKQKIALMAIGFALFSVSRIAFQGSIAGFLIEMTTMLLIGKLMYALLVLSDSSYIILAAASTIPLINTNEVRAAFGPLGYIAFWGMIMFVTVLVTSTLAYLWCRFAILPLLVKRWPSVRQYLLF